MRDGTTVRSPPALDAIVVGSGPNGLVAAITLARAGLSVLVREAASTPGGGARSAELTLPGHVHDRCAAVLPLAFASGAISELPLERHGLEWVHPDAPLAHALDDGRAVVLDRELETTATCLGDDGPAWRRLFEPLVRDWPLLAGDLLGPPRMPRHPIAVARFGWSALQRSESLARSRFAGEPARALLAGLAAHSMLPLDRQGSSAIALVLGILGHASGWPFPKGGTGSLTRALLAHLAELGGRVETDAPVGSLRELPPARAVLLDLTPRQVVRIGGDTLPPRYRRALQRYRYGVAAFKMDWVLDGPVPWTASECGRAGVVHVGGTLAEIAASELAPWDGAVSERPFVLLAQQSLFDPTRAPAGHHVAWGYCHVPHAWTGDATERIEAQIERFAPGFRQRILARHVMTPRDLESGNANLVGGDINGGVQDLAQTFARPVASLTPHATPVPGLYLCSASTPPGGGVHGLCGWHAARLALRRTFGMRS